MARFDLQSAGPEGLAAVLAKHQAWLAGEPGGERADLRGADLTDAILTDATLTDAILTGADLTGADLHDANLRGADLTDAKFAPRTIIETGETWEVYLAETVPQLLLAGERGVEAVRGWGKHTWEDCPLRIAFDIRDISQGPALLRPRMEQFLRLYDAGLIPQPDETALERARGGA